MRSLNIGLIALLASTQYALWFGDKNVFDLHRLNQTAEQVRIGNEALTVRNNTLLAEVIDLKSGGETIETLARSELGLIKQNETFFQIVE